LTAFVARRLCLFYKNRKIGKTRGYKIFLFERFNAVSNQTRNSTLKDSSPSYSTMKQWVSEFKKGYFEELDKSYY